MLRRTLQAVSGDFDIGSSAPPRSSAYCVAVATAIVLTLWLGLLFAGRSAFFRDPGTFWHTVVGQRIIDRGELPRSDEFTYTFAGRRWIAHQWLAECGMALLFKCGGFDFLFGACCTLLATVYGGIAYRWLLRGWNPAVVVLMLVGVLAVSSHHFHVRPHLFSIALMAWMFALLCDVEAARRAPRHLAWLVPVFALWANVHGGVLGGLATLAIVAMGWMCRRTSISPRILATVTLACSAALLVNPFGTAQVQVWLEIMRLSLPKIIQEHKHFDPHDPAALMLLVLGTIYLLGLSSVPWRKWRMTWILPAVWFVLSLDRIRHAPLFAVMAALALAEMGTCTRWSNWASANDYLRASRAVVTGRRPLRWAMLMLAAIATAIVPASLAATNTNRSCVRLDPACWPVELMPRLQSCSQLQPGRRIFNSLDFGGFLILYAPHLPIFIDDRCELFGERFLTEYALAERSQPQRIDHWQQQYGFDLALVRCGSPFDAYLGQHAQWKQLQRDQAGALYELHLAPTPSPALPAAALTNR